MDKFTGTGLVAGTITWLACIGITITQLACLKTDSCGGGDFFVFALIGIGMLAPAWIVAMLVSDIFGE